MRSFVFFSVCCSVTAFVNCSWKACTIFFFPPVQLDVVSENKSAIIRLLFNRYKAQKASIIHFKHISTEYKQYKQPPPKLVWKAATHRGDSHLFEVAHGVFGPVDVAHHSAGELVRVGIVVLRESQEQSQHPDHAHNHFGLCRWHALLQRVYDGHVPVKKQKNKGGQFHKHLFIYSTLKILKIGQ